MHANAANMLPNRLVQLSAGGGGRCPDKGLDQATEEWRTGQISNLVYLLLLNRLVGRRLGDRTFAPQLPWVLDMTEPPEDAADTVEVHIVLFVTKRKHGCTIRTYIHPTSQIYLNPHWPVHGCMHAAMHAFDVLYIWDLHNVNFTLQGDAAGWRDLGKTKWRLAKGDVQLDFTYRSSRPPHHISDEAMSELSVCIYLVRPFELDRGRGARRNAVFCPCTCIQFWTPTSANEAEITHNPVEIPHSVHIRMLELKPWHVVWSHSEAHLDQCTRCPPAAGQAAAQGGVDTGGQSQLRGARVPPHPHPAGCLLP